jgi:hypothetical protein
MAETTERDPRVDPRPGDVLRGLHSGEWYVTERRKKHMGQSGSIVFHHGYERMTGSIGLKKWQRFMKDATIIRKGDVS